MVNNLFYDVAFSICHWAHFCDKTTNNVFFRLKFFLGLVSLMLTGLVTYFV